MLRFIILSCTKRSFDSHITFIRHFNLPVALAGLLSSDEEPLSKSLACFTQDINKAAEDSFSLSSFNREFGLEAHGPENSVELTQSSERYDQHPHYAELVRKYLKRI